MAWHDDTDALVIARGLLADLQKPKRNKKGKVVLREDEERWCLRRLERLVAILEADSITCTCVMRPRGNSVDMLCDW